MFPSSAVALNGVFFEKTRQRSVICLRVIEIAQMTGVENFHAFGLGQIGRQLFGEAAPAAQVVLAAQQQQRRQTGNVDGGSFVRFVSRFRVQ